MSDQTIHIAFDIEGKKITLSVAQARELNRVLNELLDYKGVTLNYPTCSSKKKYAELKKSTGRIVINSQTSMSVTIPKPERLKNE